MTVRQVRLGNTSLNVVSLGIYEGALAHAIRRFKFSGRADLARRLVRFSPGPLPNVSLGNSPNRLLVPVPHHYNRLVERGFNHSALLAREWARTEGVGRYAGDLLVRVVDTPQQSRSVSRSARKKNVTGAFAATELARDQHVVVVDDVVTTGATVISCAEALYAKGAATVHALCLATPRERNAP